MSKPHCMVNNTMCVHGTLTTTLLESTHINDIATPSIVTSSTDIISLTFFMQPPGDCTVSLVNFPVNDLYHNSISNKLFGFVLSRSYESIMTGVCGMRSADQDHRIWAEPMAIGSFLEAGPGANFMHYFSIIIQIWRKLHSALIQDVVKWSLWNFAHGTTAVLSWHV